MASRPDVLREWLASLTLLVGAPGNRDEIVARMAVFIPFLLKAVPIEAFTPVSVEAIARHCKGFMPSYGDLCELLKAWWSENRPDKPPKPLVLEPPQYRVDIPKRRPEPDDQEVAAVSEIVSAFTMERAALRSAQPEAQSRRPRAYHLSDAALLATYEAMGPTGAVRASMLRQKLAPFRRDRPMEEPIDADELEYADMPDEIPE